jgi:hypothetical protein
MPFWMLLVGIGTIVDEADPIIFFTIVVAAGVGAALGDWLSYWLGYYYHEQVQRLWPLRNHPELLDKGRAFFKLGNMGHCPCSLFRSTTRQRADCCRDRGNAGAEVPERQLDVRLPVGLCSPLTGLGEPMVVKARFVIGSYSQTRLAARAIGAEKKTIPRREACKDQSFFACARAPCLRL